MKADPTDRLGIGEDAGLDGFVLAGGGHLRGAPLFFAIPPSILTEPCGNQRRVVIEDEFVPFEPESLTNILPGNIGTKLLIAIAGTIKDEAKLQGHVEAWQASIGRNFSARNVMNTISAVFDDLGNLIHADFSRVFRFKGRARDIATIMDCEDQRLHQRGIGFVKRAVDEYIDGVICGCQQFY